MKPDPVSQNAKASTWSAVKRKSKKVLMWTVLFILFLLMMFLYWNFYKTYNEGTHRGVLQKFSRKGNLFKTYEGELLITNGSGEFSFSVTNDSVAMGLDTLQGRTITVHYLEKHSSLFWRGDSPFLVDWVKAR